VSEDAFRGWESAVFFLASLKMIPGERPGDTRPYFLHLTACGKAAWKDFTRDHAAEVNHEDFPDFLRGPWAKLRGYGARLALVIHCLREAAGSAAGNAVDGDSIKAGARLVGYFKSHARRMLAAIDADPVVPGARRLLHWASREGVSDFKAHDAYQAVKSQSLFPRLDSLERPLERLVQHGYLRPKLAEARPGPGRPPAPRWEVHPDLSEHLIPLPQNPRNPQNSDDEPHFGDSGDSGDRGLNQEQGEGWSPF